METSAQTSAETTHCPKCGSSLTDDFSGCPDCGYTLEGTRLYNPKYFVVQALLLSAAIPLVLAASNWGRLGNRGRKLQWLAFGFVFFTLLFSVFVLLPESTPLVARLPAYLINVPLAWYLYTSQRRDYQTALELGAEPASSLLGSLKGVGLILAALALSNGAFFAYATIEFNRAVTHLEAGRCDEAGVGLERLLRLEVVEETARFDLGRCYIVLSQWEEAAEEFRKYLQLYGDDPDAHAFLASVLEVQGLQAEADRHYSTAEELDPEVLTRLFGPPP